MDQQFLSFVENSFRCHITGVKQRRTVYLVRTNKGPWVIKTYDQFDKANWVTDVAEHLRRYGCPQTVRYITNVEGFKVVPYQDRFFTVMRAIEGREASYADMRELKRAASTLAKFHLAAQGFIVPVHHMEQKPPLQEKWERRFHQFEHIVGKIEGRGPKNRLEYVIMDIAKEVRRDAKVVLSNLQRISLTDDFQESIRQGNLAHRDVASHNFLLTERGSCYLIDLDTVAPDSQIVDLVQMIGRALFLHGYNPLVFSEVVQAYSEVKPLHPQHITMIFQLLRYPDNALREVTGVYGKHPGYATKGVVQLLQMERRLKVERRKFFQQTAGNSNLPA